MVRKLNHLTVAFFGAAAWFLVVVALWGSTPAQLRPLGVTLWFIFLLIGLSCGLALLLDLLKRLLGPKKPQGREFKPSLRQGLLISIWLVILLALSSLRQLSIRDVLLIGLLLIIIEIYMRLT